MEIVKATKKGRIMADTPNPETMEAILSELSLYRFAVIHEPHLPVGRVKECNCMGPNPECFCAKRERLIKEFMGAGG